MTNNDPSTPAQLSLDLENDLPSVLQFNVGVNDIGGTLVAELAINQGRVSCLLSDILALKQESSFIRYCWDVLKVSTALSFCLVCGLRLPSCSVLKYWL